ncbi:MAG: hypothetical protein ACOVKC_03420 [Brevundimonas sp.]
MTRDELLDALKRATDRLDYLEGIGAGVGLDVLEVPPILARLTPQCRALVGLLLSAAGTLSAERIAMKVPNRTLTASGSPESIKVQVHYIRKHLGRDAIETAGRDGYRLGKALRDALRPPISNQFCT